MGLDVYFRVTMKSLDLQKPPAVFEDVPTFGFGRALSESSGQAWVKTVHTVTLLSLGKAHGIYEFVKDTLGVTSWGDGGTIAKVPERKVCL